MLMCGMKDEASNILVITGFPVSDLNVTADTKRDALFVNITWTSAFFFFKNDANDAALYAAILPVTQIVMCFPCNNDFITVSPNKKRCTCFFEVHLFNKNVN